MFQQKISAHWVYIGNLFAFFGDMKGTDLLLFYLDKCFPSWFNSCQYMKEVVLQRHDSCFRYVITVNSIFFFCVSDVESKECLNHI